MIIGDSTWTVGGPRTSTRWRGKALVVTETPGVRGYVVDGETGLTGAPGDPVARRGRGRGCSRIRGSATGSAAAGRARMRWDD